MQILESVRNLVEGSRVAERAYNTLASFPGYRSMVVRSVHRRIETVRRERCYSIMLELSSICNARCLFCPYSNMKREKRVMSDELFDVIVSRLLEERIFPPKIDLFDVGEPLVDRNLFSRARRLRVLFPAAQICLTSNFGLATPAMIDEIVSCGLNSIRISLNAASPDTYHEIMGLDYRKTVRNIEMLLEKRRSQKSSLSIILSMVICDQNQDQTRSFIRTWARRVDSVTLQRTHEWTGAVTVSPSYAPVRLYPCNDLFERITFLSNGELAICCTDSEGSVGKNVFDTPILEAFDSESFIRLRDVHLHGDISSLVGCRNCFGVHSNGGSWIFRRFR
jgi:uncharacterized Fe-S cluster-containing radical SAM superfamily protein